MDADGELSSDTPAEPTRLTPSGEVMMVGRAELRDPTQEPDVSHVRKPKPKDGGLYVDGTVFHQPVPLLVDTGSALTLMGKGLYDSLPAEIRPELCPTRMKAHGVTGSWLTFYGEVSAEIEIAGAKLPFRLYVVDITQDLILGMDFLRHYRCRWDWDNNTLEVLGTITGLSTLNDPSQDRVVRLARDCWVGAGQELHVVGHLTRRSGDPERLGLVTASSAFVRKTGVAVAAALVSAKEAQVPVRLLNPNPRNGVQLKKGMVVGIFVPVARVLPLPAEGEVSRVTAQTLKGVGSADIPEHLADLFSRTKEGLTVDQQEMVTRLLVQFADVFAATKTELGRTHLVEHEIDVGSTRPIKQRTRRVPLHRQEAEGRLVNEMLEQGVIRPSNSPWASPVVLVEKKDGSVRYCIDYRQLNLATVKDSHPLPRIDESLDALSGSHWFSTLDLQSGYWQVGVKEEDKTKTAFTSRSGLFEFNVLPFGLCNAPATFQRLMERVLRGLQWKEALLYLDDIIVHGDTFEAALTNLCQVMERLRKADLKLKPKKCDLFQRQVSFLGHIVSGKGILADPAKIDKIKAWPQPTDLRELRGFLGLASYYRKFIKDFALVAEPLHALLRKDATFAWTEECQTAFEELRTLLCSAPILSYPRRDGLFILDTDASNFGIGAVLSQVQDGEERVLAYASRALSKPERNYCVTRRELLAIVHFTGYFRHYLYGTHFKVHTDHGSLRWLYNFKEPEGQVARWIERLNTFDFEIEHRPGRKHENADALSRHPCVQCGRPEEYSAQPTLSVNTLEPNELHTGIEIVEDESDSVLLSESEFIPDWLTDGEAQQPYSRSISYLKKQTRRKPHSRAELSEGELKAELQKLEEGAEKWSTNKLLEAQVADDVIGRFLMWKRQKKPRPNWADISYENSEFKYWWSRWDSLHVVNTLLCLRWESAEGQGARNRVVAPRSLVPDILEILHNQQSSGHFGQNKTLHRVMMSKFVWPKMRDSVRRWVRACDKCSARKAPHRARKSGLRQYPVGCPLERVAMDIAGPFPISSRGKRYVLVVITSPVGLKLFHSGIKQLSRLLIHLRRTSSQDGVLRGNSIRIKDGTLKVSCSQNSVE